MPFILLGLFVTCVKDGPSHGRRTVLLMTVFSSLFSFLPMWAKWTRYCGSGASNINFNIGNRSGLAVGEKGRPERRSSYC